MKFRSTRQQAPLLSFSETLTAGLASDRGLYVPEEFPAFKAGNFPKLADLSLTGEILLKPFLKGDALEASLPEICRQGFSFPAPLTKLDSSTRVLELFHGPTAAFKDFGAGFLSQCLKRIPPEDKKPWTVLVATSGDTGGAVAAAFHKTPGIEVVILFPKGMVSPFQEKQLTCWGENVRAYGVRGNFDDCQRMAKEAFSDPWFKQNKKLTSANSINIGRILPQAVYYAWSSLIFFQETGHSAGFIIPSGNLGNAIACLWAKKMGFPMGRVVMAVNANTAVADYFKTGVWKPKPTVSTLANAMDVGHPSNMERVLDLYPHLEVLKKDAAAFSVSDEQIKSAIKEGYQKWNRLWCPHTATAAFVRENLRGSGDGGEKAWIIVATAHPAKFQSVVEPLVGTKIPVPPSLEAISKKQSHFEEITPDLQSLKKKLV